MTKAPAKKPIDKARDEALEEVKHKREPGPRNKAAIEAAKPSNESRPIRTKVDLGCGPEGEMMISAPHNDPMGHYAMLQESFGTCSSDFTAVSLCSLEWMTRTRSVGQGNDEAGLNAGLALMGAVDPQDELEAALAMQMAGCHTLGVEMLARARQHSDAELTALYANMAVKLTRTFAAQVEALARLRGGANQTVRVDHVHVHEGGQAIVGNVDTPGGGRGRGKRKSHGQSDAQSKNDGQPALRCPDAQGNGVPIPGGEGAEAMPDARWDEPRRADRQPA